MRDLLRITRSALPSDVSNVYAALWYKRFNLHTFRPWKIRMIWEKIALVQIESESRNTCLMVHLPRQSLKRAHWRSWCVTGARVHYDYDCLGNRILEEKDVEDGIQSSIRYRYNKSGWLVKKEERIQGNGPVRLAVTIYEHDENGIVTKLTTPGGYEIRRSYDKDDRLKTERILDKKNGIDRLVTYAYDAAGNVVLETVEGGDGERLEAVREYDLKDRLVCEDDRKYGREAVRLMGAGKTRETAQRLETQDQEWELAMDAP